MEKIQFNPTEDRVWFVGDLINRGPQSLATLRYVRDLGESATVVLGNHDIHFLAVYYGVRRGGSKDTFKRLLAAPDVAELVEWLRHRPF